MVSKEELKRDVLLRRSETILSGLPKTCIYPMDKQLIEDIKRAGLIIVGGRGVGKSNVAKVIASQLICGDHPNLQVKITDSCQNWIHNFVDIPYQHINEETLIPDDVYFGEESFIYDMELSDVGAVQETIGELVVTDYEVHREYKKQGLLDEWIIWVVEEAQNVLGSYALNGNAGKVWLKIISESRNFNINFIFIGQRLADISTKAVERCEGYLFGRMTGDNDLKKVARICGKERGIHEVVPRLKIGEFIFWNGSDAYHLIDVPRFESERKPYLWRGGCGVE